MIVFNNEGCDHIFHKMFNRCIAYYWDHMQDWIENQLFDEMGTRVWNLGSFLISSADAVGHIQCFVGFSSVYPFSLYSRKDCKIKTFFGFAHHIIEIIPIEVF